jgi:hypothetical protein
MEIIIYGDPSTLRNESCTAGCIADYEHQSGRYLIFWCNFNYGKGFKIKDTVIWLWMKVRVEEMLYNKGGGGGDRSASPGERFNKTVGPAFHRYTTNSPLLAPLEGKIECEWSSDLNFFSQNEENIS